MKQNLLLILLFMIVFIGAKEIINIPKISEPPTIDGIIGDQEWVKATSWDTFYQTSPGENIEPTEKTEIYLAHDNNNIYCMAKCYFKDINRLRDNHCSRDHIYTTDRFYLFLDTFHSNDQAYYFGGNANGEQADGIVTEQIDPSIDIFYYSAASKTEEGFFLELSLPLESIKYKSGKEITWGIFFKRHIVDGLEEVCGFQVPRGGGNFYDNYGILHFEELPNNINLKIIPSITGSNSTFRDNILQEESTESDFQPELNIFFEPNTNLTFNATINPDFNIIEADGLEIEINSRYPRYFQEKRPFFIEQSNPFQTDLIIFNTRNIVDPYFGAKISGTVRNLSIYGLVANDEDVYGSRFNFADTLKADTNFGFLSVTKKLREGNMFVRGAATIRSFDSKENFLLSLDSNNRFNDEINADFQVAVTSNEVINENDEVETKYGYGNSFDLDFYNGTWFLNLESSAISKDYTADLGYIYDTNTIFTSTRLEYQIHSDTDQDFLRYLEIASTQNIKTKYDFTDIRSHYWEVMCGAIFKNSLEFWTGFETEMEHYLSKDFYMYYPWFNMNYEPIKQLKFNFLIVDGKGLYYNYPEGEKADFYKYETGVNIFPFSFLDLEFNQKYREMEDKFIARTYEAKVKLQFHRNFWFRVILQATNIDIFTDDVEINDFNIYPLFTYKPNANTAVYLGATNSNSEGNEYYWDEESQLLQNRLYDNENMMYFLKFSYTLDIM